MLFLDDYSHYLWVYPLRLKSEVFSKFIHFSNLVKTQHEAMIKILQCDNGGEYNNSRFHKHFAEHGIAFRFSCPHTSQQNGKAERMIRTVNNSISSLLFQAQLSPTFWAEALHVAAHIINILPSSSIERKSPHSILFGVTPTYDNLHVFGCMCFPNVNYSNLHKPSPRSTPCLFLGYLTNHRGYRCLNFKTNRIIISRHVIFDESTFPAAQKHSSISNTFNFLDGADSQSPMFQSILQRQSLPSSGPTPHLAPVPEASQAPPQPTPLDPPIQRMRTRGQSENVKPRQIYSLYTSSVSRLPSTHQKVIRSELEPIDV